MIPDADPATFTVQSVSENEYVFRDKNRLWKYTAPDSLWLMKKQPAGR